MSLISMQMKLPRLALRKRPVVGRVFRDSFEYIAKPSWKI